MDGVCNTRGDNCSAWFVAHGEEHEFRVSENRVLWGMFEHRCASLNDGDMF
jgi:hypothetical protein